MTGAERIEAALRGGAETHRPRLVPFLTAGYPSPTSFTHILPQIAAHADVVEVGVPFSDPMADGVTIQHASHVALEHGVTVTWILETLRELALDTPILLMSYLNPLLSYGPERLARDAVAAGVCGFIVPDLPHEERELMSGPLEAAGLALVELVTPLTAPDRLARIGASARGFVYAVTRVGTTGGADTHLPEDLAGYLSRVRAASAAPVMAGFGIQRAEQVAALSGHADGAIVGSALIQAIGRGEDAAAFVRGLRP